MYQNTAPLLQAEYKTTPVREECIMVIRKTSYVTFEQTSNTMVVTKATYSLWNMQ